MTASQKADKLFESLFESQYANLKRYAILLMNCQGDVGPAEEAVQDTFLIAWNQREHLLTLEKPEGWLVNTLKNVIRNTRAKELRMIKFLEQYTAQATYFYEDDHGLGDLKTPAHSGDFALLKKIYVDGYTYQEMAEELAISPSALAMRTKRAKEHLKKEYLKNSM